MHEHQTTGSNSHLQVDMHRVREFQLVGILRLGRAKGERGWQKETQGLYPIWRRSAERVSVKAGGFGREGLPRGGAKR